MTHHARRGFTVIEVVIVVSVIAVLASLAIPAYNARLQRQRLAATAETLAADVGEARFEAARRNQPLYVEALVSGKQWCWAVSTESGCSCTEPRSCQLRNVGSQAHGGVRLIEPREVRLDPGGTSQTVTVALLESPRAERLRVDLQALGRVRICSLSGPDNVYPRCPDTVVAR